MSKISPGMSSEVLRSLNGTVENIRDGEILLKDIVFYGGLEPLGRGFKCNVMGSHQIAVLNLEKGDIVELEAPFETTDTNKKIIKISKVNSIKKIHATPEYFVIPKIHNTDNSKNAMLEIPNLSVEEILGKTHPYLEKINLNFNNGYTYRKNFEKGMNIVSEVKRLPPDFAYNALKSTRVGATTNVVLSDLIQGLKTVVIVPNNDVMDAVEHAYHEFIKLTGDNTKTFRKIQSNERVCLRAQEKIEKNGAVSELPFLM